MKQTAIVVVIVCAVLFPILFGTLIDGKIMSVTGNSFGVLKIVRWIIMVAATVIIAALFGYALKAIWAFDDKNDVVGIAPFTVIDPTGNITNAEQGLGTMFKSQLDALEEKVVRSRDRIAAGRKASFADPKVPEALLAILTSKQTLEIEQGRGSGDTFPDLKIQGVDLTGLFAWIGRNLRDKPKSVAFTANLDANEGVSIVGDIQDLGLSPPHSVWIPPRDKRSLSQSVEALVFAIYQRRLAEDDDRFRRLDQEDFATMFRAIVDLESSMAHGRPNEDHRGKALNALNAVQVARRQVPDWPELSLIEARAARLTQDFDIELAALESAKGAPDIAEAVLYTNVATLIGAATAGAELERTDVVQGVVVEPPVEPIIVTRPPTVEPSLSPPPPPPVIVRQSAQDFGDDITKVKALGAGFAALAALPDEDKNSLASLAAFYPDYGQHANPLFLPWNRAFLRYVETQLQVIDPSITLPCWDLNTPGERALPYFYRTPAGSANPLYRKDRNDRANGAMEPPEHLTNDNEALRAVGWREFSRAAEALSNGRHVWVGGSMAQIKSAASDPLFYAHRCAIDRLWTRWAEARGDAVSFDESFLDTRLEPFPLRVRDVLTPSEMGYGYGTQSKE